jgi:hypothetical protein
MTNELWTEQISFYREVIDRYKFPQEPMLFLIDKLYKAGLCDKVYPSNSHEALGLSFFRDYEDRRFNPMVYISYVSITNLFTIYYQSGQGKTVFEETCNVDLKDYDFNKITNWLTDVNVRNLAT